MTLKLVRLFAIAAFALWPPTHATAATKNWNAASGNWSTSANWSPAGVPAAGDDVNIKPTDGVSRTITYDYTGPAVTLSSLGINLNGGVGLATTTLSMSSGDLTVGELDVGWSGFGASGGRGDFAQTGGTTTVTGAGLYVGVNPTDAGTYNLGGSGALVAMAPEVIGSSGPGALFQVGGSNTITGNNNLFLGFGATGFGIYRISAGTLSVANAIVVGNSGTGALNIEGSAKVSAEALSINSSSGVTLNGGTLRFNTIGGAGGLSKIGYAAGTIQLAGDRNVSLDPVITGLFGAPPAPVVIPAGKGLTVEGYAAIGLGANEADERPSVRVLGGSFASPTLAVGAFINGETQFGFLEVADGGTVTTAGNAFVPFTTLAKSAVTVTGAGSAWTVGGRLELGFGQRTALLNLLDGGLVDAKELVIADNGVVNLNGGVLRIDQYSRYGSVNFDAGTLRRTGDRSIGTDAVIRDFLGAAPTIGPGKGLTIEGTATLLTTLTLDGGTFTGGQVVGGQNLVLRRGTLSLTNQAVVVSPSGLLGGTLDLAAGMTINVALGTTNDGLVSGDGQLGGTFTNGASGELRAESGRSLRLTGPNNANAGQISLYGGMLEFTQDLTNNAGAFISGNGTLKTASLTNYGTTNFSGLANVVGDVTNAATGKIISAGGGPTTFLDDVVNQGEIRTSAGSFTVFFGSVSGAGSFTGSGTVNFEGDLKPGNSPASLQFGGDVVFGPDSSLRIELGGTTPGTTYDQLQVAGKLTLDGTLDIALINGFTPTAGDSIQIFTFASRSGDFDRITGIDLGQGLYLNPTFSPAGLTLTTTQASPGDADLNGMVNADDYLLTDRGFLGRLNGWGNGDFNHDGHVDIADYFLIDLALSSRPAPAAPAVPVPEPSTFFAVILAIPFFIRGIAR